MLTILFKTLLSLFPFIREIVESYQRGPRDRRAKNPLTPWLVLCIVFTIGLAVLSGRYILTSLENERAMALKIESLEHRLKMNNEVEVENQELKRALRAKDLSEAKLVDSSKVLTTKLETQSKEYLLLEESNDTLVARNNELVAKLQEATETLKRVQLTAEVKPPQKQVLVDPSGPTKRRVVVVKQQLYVSGHTRALVNELTQ